MWKLDFSLVFNKLELLDRPCNPHCKGIGWWTIIKLLMILNTLISATLLKLSKHCQKLLKNAYFLLHCIVKTGCKLKISKLLLLSQSRKSYTPNRKEASFETKFRYTCSTQSHTHGFWAVHRAGIENLRASCSSLEWQNS